MDLGFGSANQVLGEAVASAVLANAKAQEEVLNDEMEKYDSLLNITDAELEQLRERRLHGMKAQQKKNQAWRECGHGVYEELGSSSQDVARSFFDASKKSERLVVHFYRDTSARLCDVFHSHLQKLAPKHLETKFCKINVGHCEDGNSGGAAYLVEKLGIVVMPTLLIVKDRKAVHHIRGFDEVGGTKDFTTEALACVLSTHGALNLREDEEFPEEVMEGQRGVNAIRLHRGTISSGHYNEDCDD